MSRVIRRRWINDYTGPSRKDNRGCEYEAYVPEALARILLRAESVASSRIEGLEIGARRLLRAEAARRLGDDPSDATAVEILGNIDAMVFAIEHVDAGDPITVELVLDV